MKLHVLTNAILVDDAIRFVLFNMSKSKKSPEDNEVVEQKMTIKVFKAE
jgi:hypothetical protein